MALGLLFATRMARPLRLHIPGQLYHVTSRGNNKQAIFTDDRDHLDYLRRLGTAVERLHVHCLAFCLMKNHVHLLLRPHDIPLSRLMQQVNSGYCQAFNRRHSCVGHVLQGRFGAQLVDSDAYQWRVLRYILRNPIVAGIVADASEWPWSSYRATAGLAAVPSFLDVEAVCALFDASSRTRAQALFRAFVSSAADDDTQLVPFPVSAGARPIVDAQLAAHRDNRDFIRRERFATRPAVEDALQLRAGETPAIAAVRAFYDYAFTLREIGEHFNRPPATIWTWIRRTLREQRTPGRLRGHSGTLRPPRAQAAADNAYPKRGVQPG